MKKLSSTLILMCAVAGFAAAQTSEGRPIPAIDVKTTDNKTINTSTFSNNGKPMIISFWATWCKPCKKELDAIAEEYGTWTKETGVKLIAMSIDDARAFAKVGPEVKAKGWEYEVYVDENQDFKRAMSVNNVPHTFVLDGKGNIVWQHNSYAEGDETALYEIVKKVAKGEKITEKK
jgi:cytochrome c biogenesis protein CcmG/thiol:disulfide interchange protein DsbE